MEAGIPGLLAGAGLFLASLRIAVGQWRSQANLALPSLAAGAVFLGLAVQGLTDTIFFRPEVQVPAFLCLATLAAADQPRQDNTGTAAAPGSSGDPDLAPGSQSANSGQ